MTKPKSSLALPPGARPDPAPELPHDSRADDPHLDGPPPEDPCAPPPEVYDPADYRWVPVRRRARYDGWTEEKQRRFIEALADTGQVRLAAKAVGMRPETAYRLRRQPHAAAFACAWDAAREQAGAFLEDVAFERALEGVEHNVYDENGEVVATRRAFNDRLLMFLLRNLKPERYARGWQNDRALATLATHGTPPGETIEGNPGAMLVESLAAMEPPLPMPVAELLDPEALEAELELAEISDGRLPQFLCEQRAELPEALAAHKAAQAQLARGAAAAAKQAAGGGLSADELTDMCHYFDPGYRPERGRKRFR